MDHSSIQEASYFSTDLPNDATLLSWVGSQASSILMLVQSLLQASKSIAVGIVFAYESENDLWGGLTKLKMQVTKSDIFFSLLNGLAPSKYDIP